MKKNVIALAVAAAMVAPMAAQAAPTVYGKARISIDSMDYSSKSTNGDAILVNDQTSRVGIKGSEDLGGGMKAIYGFEWGVDITNDGTLGSRNSYVGLSGGFGTVLAGRHDTPFKMVGSADVFGDTSADAQNNSGIIRNDNRVANAIAYVSPDLSGWTVMAAVVPGEENTGNSGDANDANGLADTISVGAKGAIGPVKVGLGYESASKKNGNPNAAKDSNATKVDLKYSMGTMGFGFTYYSANPNTDTKQDTGMLGSFTYGMGANVVALQYGQYDQHKDHGDHDFTRTSVGLIHNFSKATNAYVAYSSDSYDLSADAGNEFSAVVVGLDTQF
jgi:predicted porin